MVSAPEHSPLSVVANSRTRTIPHDIMKANETFFLAEIRLIAGLKCWEKTQCKDIYLGVFLLITKRAR